MSLNREKTRRVQNKLRNSAFLGRATLFFWTRGTVVGTETRQRGGRSVVRIPVYTRDFFPSPLRLYRLWALPSRLAMGNWGSFRGHKVVIHLHLVSRLRMTGAIPPLPQYAFMSWTGRVLPLP